MTQPKLTDIYKDKRLWLVLDNIRSVYNVGAMFRTADGTGMTGLVLVGITPTPANNPNKIQKTALGAQDHIPWVYFQSVEDFLSELERVQDVTRKPEHGAELVALELTSRAVDIFTYDINKKKTYFLVVGNELLGVSAQVLVHADTHVYIPMHGFKESLNVAESASIAMYEFYRKFTY